MDQKLDPEMNAVVTNPKPKFQFGRVALAALAGGALAGIANLVLSLLLRAVGVDFVIQQDPAQPAAAIPVPAFFVASFLPAFFAAGLLLVLGRFTAKAWRLFVIIASVFAVLSLGGPATVAGASAGTRIALMSMHVIAAIAITGSLMRGTRPSDA